jgi:zinc/manganese transport system permease protein
VLYLLALAVAVALAAITIGSILSTALLIGPAATALRLVKATGWAAATACLTGVAATWLGVLLAYDSYDWSASHQGLPVSFFIVAVIFAVYLLSGLAPARTARRHHTPAAARAAVPDEERVAA